jgi:Tol biopolymer transport system component
VDQLPSFSPDGQRIAFWRPHEIFVMNEDGSGQLNLTNDPRDDREPAFSGDGSRIAFSRDTDGNFAPDEIFVMNGDGTGQINLIQRLAGVYATATVQSSTSGVNPEAPRITPARFPAR